MTCQNIIKKLGGGDGHEESRMHKVNSTISIFAQDPALMHDERAYSSQINSKKAQKYGT